MNMTNEAEEKMGARWSPLTAILLGGLVVGVLDILDAFVVWGLRGVGPVRILQSIASGLLGRDAYQGGAPTAVLGAALHFFIATTVTAVYVLASRWLPVLRRRAVLCGMVYGVAVFFFMNYVVLQLAGMRRGPMPLSLLANGIIGHALLVGLPAALIARRVLWKKDR